MRLALLRGLADAHLFAEHNEIIVAWVGQHTDEENQHVDGAADVPQLADVGRREDQPPCCDEPDKAPIDQELADLINALVEITDGARALALNEHLLSLAIPNALPRCWPKRRASRPDIGVLTHY